MGVFFVGARSADAARARNTDAAAELTDPRGCSRRWAAPNSSHANPDDHSRLLPFARDLEAERAQLIDCPTTDFSGRIWAVRIAIIHFGTLRVGALPLRRAHANPR